MICGDVWAGVVGDGNPLRGHIVSICQQVPLKNFHQRLSGLVSFITCRMFHPEILEKMQPITFDPSKN